MKRIIYIFLVALIFASCQKADINGDLDGFWKLLTIEELADNNVIDKKDVDRFWSIQLKLLVTKGDNGILHVGKGRFQHIGDSLFIQMIKAPKEPKELGMYNPDDERLEVVQLDRNRMILRSKEVLLNFRRF